MNNNLSPYEMERLLVVEAQAAIEATVRDWYPAYRIHALRTTLTGNIVAKLVAWQAVANSLASRLDYLGAPVDAGLVAHAQVIQDARIAVTHAVHELWPGATYTPRWIPQPVAFSVEFETYRYGAIALADRLGLACARCRALHAPPPPPGLFTYPSGQPGYGQQYGMGVSPQTPLAAPDVSNQPLHRAGNDELPNSQSGGHQ